VLDSVLDLSGLEYESALVHAIDDYLDSIKAADNVIIISPSPHDGHPRHEAVGRAAAKVTASKSERARWWCYSVWSDLPLPTLYVPFDEGEMADAIQLLQCYGGELDRNDYRKLIRGRAEANAVLGSERVFGFGSPSASRLPYAELLTEAAYRQGKWRLGKPRILDFDAPLSEVDGPDLGFWINRPSERSQIE
jgi:hypothetical protein